MWTNRFRNPREASTLLPAAETVNLCPDTAARGRTRSQDLRITGFAVSSLSISCHHISASFSCCRRLLTLSPSWVRHRRLSGNIFATAFRYLNPLIPEPPAFLIASSPPHTLCRLSKLGHGRATSVCQAPSQLLPKPTPLTRISHPIPSNHHSPFHSHTRHRITAPSSSTWAATPPSPIHSLTVVIISRATHTLSQALLQSQRWTVLDIPKATR